MSPSITSKKSIELYILFSGGIYIAPNKTGAYKTSFKINQNGSVPTVNKNSLKVLALNVCGLISKLRAPS
jgi:hypothetical protein